MPDQTLAGAARTSGHAWRAACTADANCVEVAAWRTASRCLHESNCVQIGDAGTAVGVRDSADPGGPCIVLSPDGWAALLAAIKEGGDA